MYSLTYRLSTYLLTADRMIPSPGSLPPLTNLVQFALYRNTIRSPPTLPSLCLQPTFLATFCFARFDFVFLRVLAYQKNYRNINCSGDRHVTGYCNEIIYCIRILCKSIRNRETEYGDSLCCFVIQLSRTTDVTFIIKVS